MKIVLQFGSVSKVYLRSFRNILITVLGSLSTRELVSIW